MRANDGKSTINAAYAHVIDQSVRTYLSFALSAIVGFLCLVVLMAWYVQDLTITRWCADCVTMKVPTAGAIMLQSISTCVIVAYWRSERGKGLVIGMMVATSVTMILAMTGHVPAFGDDGVKSVCAGMPSVGTALTLFAFVIVDLFYVFKDRWRAPANTMIMFTTAMSTVAILGYALDYPPLYWYIPEVSTAMSFPTALFCLSLSVAHFVSHSFKHRRKQFTVW